MSSVSETKKITWRIDVSGLEKTFYYSEPFCILDQLWRMLLVRRNKGRGYGIFLSTINSEEKCLISDVDLSVALISIRRKVIAHQQRCFEFGNCNNSTQGIPDFIDRKQMMSAETLQSDGFLEIDIAVSVCLKRLEALEWQQESSSRNNQSVLDRNLVGYRGRKIDCFTSHLSAAGILGCLCWTRESNEENLSSTVPSTDFYNSTPAITDESVCSPHPTSECHNLPTAANNSSGPFDSSAFMSDHSSIGVCSSNKVRRADEHHDTNPIATRRNDSNHSTVSQTRCASNYCQEGPDEFELLRLRITELRRLQDLVQQRRSKLEQLQSRK